MHPALRAVRARPPGAALYLIRNDAFPGECNNLLMTDEVQHRPLKHLQAQSFNYRRYNVHDKRAGQTSNSTNLNETFPNFKTRLPDT